VQTRIGTRIPFNRGATSKAMMAFLPEERFKDFCDNFLHGETEEGSKLVLEAISVRAKVRQKGYVVTYEEVNPHVAAVASPIFGFTNTLIGSMAIAGPRDRFSDQAVARYIPLIMQACRSISLQLGATNLPEFEPIAPNQCS
jgi:DNA-binding IclR family transcriptional regulator